MPASIPSRGSWILNNVRDARAVTGHLRAPVRRFLPMTVAPNYPLKAASMVVCQKVKTLIQADNASYPRESNRVGYSPRVADRRYE
jgi:hypothetical protein